MSKTIVVGGFGPGISKAVAERFGKEGFAVALVARNAERVAEGAKALSARGIRAEGFAADLSDPEAVRSVIGKVRASLGPIGILHWNAYATSAGDLLTADTAAIRSVFDIGVVGLVAGVQAALPDLKEGGQGAVLVTNGGLGYFDPQMDAVSVDWNVMGLAIANSAKHKLVGLLSKKLAKEKVYVGEVVVTGTVKGTAFDAAGHGTIDPNDIAARFWDLYSKKSEVSVSAP